MFICLYNSDIQLYLCTSCQSRLGPSRQVTKDHQGKAKLSGGQMGGEIGKKIQSYWKSLVGGYQCPLVEAPEIENSNKDVFDVVEDGSRWALG